jgi:hypothetical protein
MPHEQIYTYRRRKSFARASASSLQRQERQRAIEGSITSIRRMDCAHDIQALRVHQSTIIRHINEYHEGKLKNESGGSESKFNES